MKILRYDKENGWKTRIIYRKSMNDLIVKQWNKEMNQYRTIYLFDEKRDICKDLYIFLRDRNKS